MKTSFFALLCIAVALSATPAFAQVTTGTPPFGSFGGGPDVINLGNLNTHITVPVLNKAGRGTPFAYNLSYDTSLWYPVTSNGTTSWQPVYNWGWRGQTEVASGYLSYSSYQTNGCCSQECFPRIGCIQVCTGGVIHYSNFVYHDQFGVPHSIPGTTTSAFGGSGCQNYGPSLTATASDASGYTLNFTGSATITSRAGSVWNVPINTGTGVATYTDRNGNEISVSSSGVFTDTLGTTALTVSGTPPSPTTFTFTAPSGANAAYTMNYTPSTVQTNFGCSGITEYSASNVPLVTEIDLPDQLANTTDKFTFIYETTPGDTHSPHYVTGRLASVTLPTGGTVSYTYPGGSNGIECTDGSTAGLSRVTPDGTWTYARSGSGSAWTTTVTDPQNNQTVIHFQQESTSHNFYETERQAYQGSISGTLLKTLNTCYNGNTSNCNSTAVTLPITQRNITTILPNAQQSEHDDFWNAYGGPTETDDYDYGAAPHGALLRKALATYASLGNITAFRQTVTVQNGSGATVSKVNYNYDETTPTGTSGTPQHVSVSTPRGNLTSTNIYTSSTTYLTKRATYYDTGTLNTTTDFNGGVTTYFYASTSASCGNSFSTSITEAITTLSTSMTWNCTGGFQLTSTDENGQTTTTSYTDPYFWRPASVTDPTGAVTTICYGLVTSGTCTLNPNQSESTLTFNSGNSAADTVTVLDDLGRTQVHQRRQAPGSSNFDSVETDYDALGRVSRVTLPYTGTAGQTNSTIAGTTTSYDAMSRPLTIQDGGLGTTTYYYGQGNDVLVTRGPAPSGENTKRRQFEYDGLGRLTSVCEVTAGTTAWPGGNCAENTAQTGYWTKYSYDPMSNLLTLAQNAQMSGFTQSRSYAYDWMNRLTLETNPESGTTNYYYDSDSTCAVNSASDLVKRVDAVGNTTCYAPDALHRVAEIFYSGPYSTPAKYFIFDSATVDGNAMQNARGRLAEAYTATCFSCSKITDIGFSYTARGEVQYAYESTPHSGGYYWVQQTYWPNGVPNLITNNLGNLTGIIYGVDGEGRTTTVSAGQGQNPVVSTSYNPGSLVTALNLGSGSGDNDAYTYDPNTNRMSQYKFTVNAISLTGAFGWNANGTVQSQNIADGFNSADTQNCSYGYDDMTRLTGANCGNVAAQTFSYDPFGNIDKSGSPYTFQPSYSPSTNHITQIAGFTPTYDSNGNVTNDSFHTYAWDANGHTTTVDAGESDAVNLTYDAQGRMVEQSRSGGYTQIVYSPTGGKFALMNGQTLQKAMVPLPRNGFAVYSSSGLQYYGHADLLGSIRLGTTPNRSTYFDTAYAPFGETYATTGTLDAAYTGMMNDTAHRQDTAGGLYDFPAREYSIQGRWPSPDPAGVASTCPKDPQTQNRYAYVRNNPMSYTDPTGMYPGAPGPTCDPSTDPFCLNPFPPPGGCTEDDPNCSPVPIVPIIPPIGGGGGGGNRGTGSETSGGSCACGCPCSKPSCWIAGILFGCAENYGPEGCKETIFASPGVAGNQCAGMTPPFDFVSEWSCAGDIDCCRKKEAAFINSCYDKGPGYVVYGSPGLGGSMETQQCCKEKNQPKKP